jgi:amino acid transporter
MRTPQGFTRQLKVFGVLLLTLSAVTPAASVYVIVPGIIQEAGTGVLASMALGALISLLVAFAYAEVASAHPITGGEYALFGRTAGALSGLTLMYAMAVSIALSGATLALGASEYLRVVWPGAPEKPIAAAFLLLAALAGVLNIRLNAVVTGCFLTLEIAIILVIATLGWLHPARDLGPMVLHPVLTAAGRFAPTPFASIGLATTVAVYAFNGFSTPCTFTEEMIAAPRRVARTILMALLATVALEVVPVVALLMGAPDLKALLASTTPFSDFVRGRGGHALSVVVSLGVAAAILNALIAISLINGRFFFSTGRNLAWPRRVNAALLGVHPRFNSPWVATLVAGALAVAVCFAPLNVLLLLSGQYVVLCYGAICISAIVGRMNGSTRLAAYRMPFYPWPPALGLLALAYTLYCGWMDPAVGRPSVIITAAMLLVALALSIFMLRRRGPGWTILGPGDEAAAPESPA